MKKALCIIASILMIAALMCSCGSKSASDDTSSGSSSATSSEKLNKYILSESFQKQIDEINKQYDTIKIEAFGEGNTIVYKYTYVKQLTDEEVKERKEAVVEENLKSGAKTVLETFVKIFDEPDLGVSYRYYNKDGSLIKQVDFGRDILE